MQAYFRLQCSMSTSRLAWVNYFRMLGICEDILGLYATSLLCFRCLPLVAPGPSQCDVCCLSQVMKRDADVMRQDGPTLFTQAKNTVNIDKVAEHILSSYALAVGASSS